MRQTERLTRSMKIALSNSNRNPKDYRLVRKTDYFWYFINVNTKEEVVLARC